MTSNSNCVANTYLKTKFGLLRFLFLKNSRNLGFCRLMSQPGLLFVCFKNDTLAKRSILVLP